MQTDMNSKIQLPQSPEQFLASADGGAALIAALVDPQNWRSIPLLNYTPLHQLRDQSVVRFRGMIQDMSNPEIYLDRFVCSGGGTIRHGKYRDRVCVPDDLDINAKTTVQGSRRTFFVVSVPGLNDWACSLESECNKSSIPTAEETMEIQGAAAGGSPKKRTANEAAKTMAVVEEANKRLRVSENTANSKPTNATTLSAEYLLNSPIPERPSKACMVKIYDDFDKYTLNSMVDVVGFLSIDPSLDGSTMEVDDEDVDFASVTELRAQNPPPSLIPRLHALVVHELPHANPLLDARLLDTKESDPNKKYEALADTLKMGQVHSDLRKLLGMVVFNDDLAVDYLLSHLISTVYSRSEGQCIGKCTLNIYNIPAEVLESYAKELYKILELLLPSSHYLAMSLETLNTATFLPKKDYESNKLASGLLQLAPHTHLVLDETKMQQGKLGSSGVTAVQNLAELINQQQIKCNFQYYDIDYDVDVPVLVLSEGRSLLPNDFALPLKMDISEVGLLTETLKAAHHYLDAERLDRFRRYITLAKIKSFNMNTEIIEMIQTDFVEMRKAKLINGAEDLHKLLVLSRLLGIARGAHNLDKDWWKTAKELEAQRKERVEELRKSKVRIGGT